MNNMLIERDWLNILVDRGENKVALFKLTKYDFATPIPGASILLFFFTMYNMNTSRGRKRIYPSAGLRATCLSRGRKTTPTTGRRRKLTSPFCTDGGANRLHHFLCHLEDETN